MFSKFKERLGYESTTDYRPTTPFEKVSLIYGEDLHTFSKLRLQLSQSIDLLQQSYDHFNTNLLPILPDLLGSQAVTVTPYPQISLPLVGTLFKMAPTPGSKKLMSIKKTYLI